VPTSERMSRMGRSGRYGVTGQSEFLIAVDHKSPSGYLDSVLMDACG